MTHPWTRLALTIALLSTACVSTGCQFGSKVRLAQANVHLDLGKTYYEQGLEEKALEEFNRALEENPLLMEAHMGMGDVHRGRKDYQTAGVAYERAAELAPTSFHAHYYLGLMKQLVGDLAAAVRVYLRALTINPDSFEANQNLASAYLQLGKPGNAIHYAKRATQLRGQSQAAWSNLAAAYSLMGRYGRAVDAYREAVELGEMAAPVLLGLADAHIRLKHYDRAAVVLRTLIRREPSATAYERVGYAQFKLHRFDDALTSYRAALSIDNRDPAALNGLGACLMTLYIQGGRRVTAQRNEALNSWRRSVQVRPNQSRIIDLIARYQRI